MMHLLNTSEMNEAPTSDVSVYHKLKAFEVGMKNNCELFLTTPTLLSSLPFSGIDVFLSPALAFGFNIP